ncbi:hypothetical protein QA802_33665 [Streptomyces sp. B21-105]|uniref:hypothetical protein n=1 Tax=Streptomyces sp. B21-105 TaxID=3039417 RepID=UPI002FF32A24
MDLSVEQLPFGGHACVSREAAGPYGRNGGEEIGDVVVLGWLNLPDRTENGAAQVLEHINFLTPFHGHDPVPIRLCAAAY